MSDWPSFPLLEALPTVHVGSLESVGPDLAGTTIQIATIVSGAWPGASRAQFAPFYNFGRRPIVVQRLWWLNGTPLSGNVDMGIYDATFRRLVSTGSVLQAGVSVIQGVAVSLALPPGGPYYFALACDNVTAQFARFAALATDLTLMGCATATPAFPLPPVATLGPWVANSYLPYMGLSQRGFP